MRCSAKYVGLDVHQSTTLATVRQASGKIIARSVLPTEEAALLEFFAGMRGAVHVAFEEGTQAQWLHDLPGALDRPWRSKPLGSNRVALIMLLHRTRTATVAGCLIAVEPEVRVTPLVPDREHKDMVREYAIDDQVGKASHQKLPRPPAHWRANFRIVGQAGEGAFDLGRELRTEEAGLPLVEERGLPDVRLSYPEEDDWRHRLSSALISASASTAGMVRISPARYC
jgi:hypothetical protein